MQPQKIVKFCEEDNGGDDALKISGTMDCRRNGDCLSRRNWNSPGVPRMIAQLCYIAGAQTYASRGAVLKILQRYRQGAEYNGD